MSSRAIAISASIFLTAFLLEEALFNQIRLPASGFTFFLIFTFIWASLSTPEVGGITGFFSGLLLDLSHNSGAPFGMWTLILSLVAYGVSFVSFGDERLHTNAFSVVVITVSAIAIAQLAFIVFGSFLGMETGTLAQILRTILGAGLWNTLATPIIFPLVNWLYLNVYEARTHS